MEFSCGLAEDCPVTCKRLSYTVKWKRISAFLALVALFLLLGLTFITQQGVHDFKSRYTDLYIRKSRKNLPDPTEIYGTELLKSTQRIKEIDLSFLAVDGFYPELPVVKVSKPLSDFENPDLSFSVVIDCGSSGSRLFVYRWPKHSGNPNALLKIQHMRTGDNKIVVKKVEPGISSFAPKPYEIVRYITPLLRYAEKNIPKNQHKYTPLYILCTAGMRLLSTGLQAKVLDSLRSEIPLLTDFLFEPSHAEVLSGQTEGLYSWVSLNYVLGNMNKINTDATNESDASNINSVGIIDMGGGSMQIAYEVASDKHYYSREHILDINLSGDTTLSNHRYKVYVETFLRKGANSIRKEYENMLANIHFPTVSTYPNQAILDPCLPLGLEKYLPIGKGSMSKTILLNGTGNLAECKTKLLPFLNKDSCQNDTECIIDGEKRPKINFNKEKFYGISEFYYTMEDILHIAGKYDKNYFEDEASKHCKKSWTQSFHDFKQGQYPIADEFRMRMQCFKSAWMSVAFHDGLNFPDEYKNFQSVKMVNNNEIQWTLGALLYKTRFLPLREIQQAKFEHKTVHNSFYNLGYLSQNLTLLILCIVIVSFSVLLYGVRFWLSHNHHRVASLKRVGSSVAYFVHEDIV